MDDDVTVTVQQIDCPTVVRKRGKNVVNPLHGKWQVIYQTTLDPTVAWRVMFPAMTYKNVRNFDTEREAREFAALMEPTPLEERYKYEPNYKK